MTDLYEFNDSMANQSMDYVTPFSSKKWNWISDTNNGAYTNSGGQTLVQFDGSSIYNGGEFIEGGELYLALPIVRVAAFASDTAGTMLAPTADSVPATSTSGIGNEFLTTLKAGSWNLIQSIECVVNGKTIVQQTP